MYKKCKNIFIYLFYFSILIQCSSIESSNDIIFNDDYQLDGNTDQDNGNTDQDNGSTDKNQIRKKFIANLTKSKYTTGKKFLLYKNTTTAYLCPDFITIQDNTDLTLSFTQNLNKRMFETAKLEIISETEAISDGGAFACIISWVPITTRFKIKIIDNKLIFIADHFPESHREQVVAINPPPIEFPKNLTEKEIENFYLDMFENYKWYFTTEAVKIPGSVIKKFDGISHIKSASPQITIAATSRIDELQVRYQNVISIQELKINARSYPEWRGDDIEGSLFIKPDGLYLFSTNETGFNRIAIRGLRK